MTGLNHVATGALIASVVRPSIAIPLAFITHFAMDAIPHYGWQYEGNVFKRNSRREFQIGLAVETLGVITALIVLPLVLEPTVQWWATLAAMLSALFMDLIWIYRGIGEIITAIEKPRNWIMNIHLSISNHHQKAILGFAWEFLWLTGVLALIFVIIRP